MKKMNNSEAMILGRLIDNLSEISRESRSPILIHFDPKRNEFEVITLGLRERGEGSAGLISSLKVAINYYQKSTNQK